MDFNAEQVKRICDTIKTKEDIESICDKYEDEIVNIMKKKYKSEILKNVKKSNNPTAYIVGGQNASGKTTLINQLYRDNIINEDSIVPIIIDDMKAHHPFREFIDKNYPEQSEPLLHKACFRVFDEVMDELIAENYNILLERTMGSLDKAKNFIVKPANKGYKVQIHVMATHGINSYISALERFVQECLLKDKYRKAGSVFTIEPRPISPGHHDDTYNNIVHVLSDIESGIFKDNKNNPIYPDISIWDRTPEKPTNIYQTEKRQYHNVKEAIETGRCRDLKRCKTPNTESNIEDRISTIEEIIELSDEHSTVKSYENYCNLFLGTIKERTEGLELCEKKQPSKS